MILHGLDLSYFTGKLEGYLRLKGLPYRFEPMNTAAFMTLGDRAGVRQMPHLTLADGRLLTDTVVIIDALEGQYSGASCPSLTPDDQVTAFVAHLVEAFADEHLWRPALYYRWAFDDDARLASHRLADTLLRDVRAPVGLKRAYILQRQRWLYLRGEGSGPKQAGVVQADYLALLDALEPVFRKRDWLLGDAPTRADVGLFGPLFRHFLCDPTPGQIMRERAPATASWAMRLWASDARRPPCARDLAVSTADLAPLIALITDHFLPEAEANAQACAQKQRMVSWTRDGVRFRYRVNPYRAWRLGRLSQQFSTLPSGDQGRVRTLLGDTACRLLSPDGPWPAVSLYQSRTRDRWWHPA